MSYNTTYDFAIYGGSPAGVIFALKKREQGKKVILINRFGFLGGCITAGLNCLQELKISEGAAFCSALISALRKQSSGVLFSDGIKSVLNPESVKMILPELLKASGTDILLHVNPMGLKIKDDNQVEIELMAREGALKIKASMLVDASENFLFSFIQGDNRPRETERKVNFFVKKPSGTEFLGFGAVSKYVKLNDGRYWISLNRQDSEAESIAGRFASVLQHSASRIQLMPAETYHHYELNGFQDNKGPVSSVEDLLGKNFKPDEQLLKAAELEKQLCG